MPRPRVLLGVLGLSLLVAALAVGMYWVRTLEDHELLYETSFVSLAQRTQQSGSTKISARVGQVALTRGEQATFEICADGDLSSPALEGAFELLVWRPEAQKLELKVALDAQHRALVKRGGGGAA